MAAGVSIHADTSALTRLSQRMAEASPKARKTAQKIIRHEATVVKEDAANRASFSKRIAGSGKVRMSGFNAKVTFGGRGNAAWIAQPIENGGRGNVSHPTFGHEPTTAQGSHPAFLGPAFAAHSHEIIDVVTRAVTDAIATMMEGEI